MKMNRVMRFSGTIHFLQMVKANQTYWTSIVNNSGAPRDCVIPLFTFTQTIGKNTLQIHLYGSFHVTLSVVIVGHCRRSPMHCVDPSLKWSDSFVMNTKKDKNYFVLHSSSNCPEHTDNKFEYLGIYYTWTLVYRGVQKYVIFLARHNNAST